MSNAKRKLLRGAIRRECERRKMSNAGRQAGYNYRLMTNKESRKENEK